MVASKSFTLPVGAYGSIITGVRFDSSSSNLTVLGTSPSGLNPSWIATHPLNNSILISTNEANPTGGLSTFLVTDRAKGVVVRSSNASTGADPAYIVGLTKARQVTVTDYSGGSGSFIPLREDLFTLDESKAQRVKFNAAVSHPRQAVEYEDEVLILDLANNGTVCYLSSPGILYTLNELKSTLVSQTFPPLGSSKQPKAISSLSIVPKGANSSTFRAAELIFDENWGLLYASNRDFVKVPNPARDSIATFGFAKTSNLKLVNQIRRLQVFTGLNRTRAMSQGGDDIEYIVTGGGLVVYEKSNNGRDLQ